MKTADVTVLLNRGFTLIELVVTVAIIGLLASMALPLTEMAHRRAQEQELRAALRTIRTALDAYKQASDEGRILRKVGASGYPPNLEILVEGVEDVKSPDRRTIYFLRRIPRDPLYDDLNSSAERTWGLRSYSSPPDRPNAGEDVFDVYSHASGTGLNGIPYKEW